MTNYCHRQMKEEEGRRNIAIKAFQVAEKSLKEMKKKLLEEEKERKYSVATLVLRNRLRPKGCSCEVLRTSWPPPRPKLRP